MKPLKLEFSGINSFSEKAVIDFSLLTQNGIFGIFGDTGSGKSTILDSIHFALYGDIDRSKEKTDIINYKCDAAEVTFTFDILSEGVRKKYVVERSLKRKSGTHKAFLYEIINGESRCIADNATTVKAKIISVLGLEAEDFRKCIALPQGEFSQFVKSQPAERIKLIERLFSLSKYGIRLKEKLSVKESEVNAKYNELLGKLSVYEDATQENVNALQQSFKISSERQMQLADQANAQQRHLNELTNLREKKKELDETQAHLRELSELHDKMEGVRKTLNVAESCKEILASGEELSLKKREAAECEKQSESLSLQIKRLREALTEAEKRIREGDYDTRITSKIEALAKFEACADQPKRLLECENKLKPLRAEYYATDNRIKSLQKNKISIQKKLNALTEQINAIGNVDIESFVGTTFKNGILKEEYGKQINIFADMKEEVEEYNDGSALYEFIVKRLREQIQYYGERIKQIRDVNAAEVLDKLKAQLKKVENRNDLLQSITDVKTELSACESDLRIALSQLDRIRAQGDEINEQKARIKRDLSLVFGENCADYEAAVLSVKSDLENLKKEKESLKQQSERLEGELKDKEMLLSSSLTKLQTSRDDIDKGESKLSAKMKSIGFKNLEQCSNALKEIEKYPDAEITLKNYDKNIAALEARLSALRAVEGIEGFTEEHFARAQREKNEADEQLKNASNELAVLAREHETLLKRRAEKLILEKTFSEVISERNLVYQLKDLIKNNKFMEFIANEYLYDISSLASGTLLKLTCGRYFLTYRESFYVGDNFDCGNLRGVNTLSGGETFLVSLSLALALSSTICAKSMKSIEFFFLDEGFGTLDETLIDTVMDALEKLKSEQFTIGIISHVEELKHRIDSKITVYKATESHGSTVQLSC